MDKAILIIVLLFSISIGFGQSEWELKKDKDGIKVYTREVEGSSLKAFKAITVMDGKLSSFVAVLKDVKSYSELFGDMTEAEIIEMQDTFQVHSSVSGAPWPVSDRYGVYSNTYSQRYDHKTVTVKVNALQGYIADKEDKVRITEAEGQWIFHPVEYNKVEVTFEMHVDPGGNIPKWVLNMFLVDTPYNDLKTLRERVKLPQYQNKKYDFLVEF